MSKPACAIALVLAVAVTANAAPHYKVVTLFNKDHPFVAKAINAAGVVAGEGNSKTDGSGGLPAGQTISSGALFDGAVRVIPPLDGVNSRATAINAAGHVTGIMQSVVKGTGGYFYDGKELRLLDPTRKINSVPLAMNARDQIAGYLFGQAYLGAGTMSAVDRPFLYDGTLHDLGDFGGHSGRSLALDDAGRVVGYASLAGGIEHAFLYDGTLHDLGVPTGCAASHATGIGNAGRIVGTAYNCAGASTHAFEYDGSMRLLPGAAVSSAAAANARGDIVGSAQFGGAMHAALWQGGEPIDLNAQVPENAEKLTFSEALAENDAGSILVKGNRDHIYLLVPMSEADSAATLARIDNKAQADHAAFLANVNPLNGSGAKIAHAGSVATLTYTDAGGTSHSYAVVRPKMVGQSMANIDTGGWIYAAPDHKSGVIFNVTASGGVDGKPLNPMMLQMMVGP